MAQPLFCDMKASRGVLLVALALLGIAAVRDVARLGGSLPWHQMFDFPDFYCAGAVLDYGADPYRYEPLHRCEHAVSGDALASGFFWSNPNIAIPAPQPPYDFPPFMALARLSFVDARAVDAVAIAVSVALCVAALAALGVPLEVALAALALSTVYVELSAGQIVPFALLALALCGLALARRQDALAGVLAALTAIEPIVGVPVIAATLLFVPRARATVLASAFVLAVLSAVIVGPRVLFEYFTAVLPAHANSELYFPFQYSLTYVLGFLGLAPSVARLAGAISYLVLLVVGLRLAPAASTALRRRELLVFLPALCAVIGGPFLHQEELCFAIPALAILAIDTQGKTRAVAAVALCALSIPWILIWGAKQLFLASLFVCAVILLRLRVDLRIGFATLVVIAAIIYAFWLAPLRISPAPPLRTYAANELAQNSWRDYTESLKTPDVLWLAIKFPTWGALLAALAIAAGCARRSPSPSESSPG